MGFRERSGHGVEDVERTLGRLGAVEPDEDVEPGSVEELHRVVEDALRSAAEIEDGNRVRVTQTGGELDLTLEAQDALLARLVGWGAA